MDPTKEPCPKCQSTRKTTHLRVSVPRESEGHVWVRLGGLLRNRDNRDLYAIVCVQCGFSEIYAK